MSVRVPAHGRGQRVGLMGGSFNPPHEGHWEVADTAMRRLRLDQVWWIVTPGNPLKGHGDLPPLGERMLLAGRIAAHPRMRVTGFEADLGSPFTAVTIGFLKRRYPATQFVWIMGADSLAGFHRWQNWRAIAATVPMAVADRPAWRLKALASPAAQALSRFRLPESRAATLPGRTPPSWTFLTTKLIARASSDIRRQQSDS